MGLWCSLKDVKRLVQVWNDGFDWRKVEAELNELPNFRITITLDGFDPLEVHYVYQPNSLKNAIPLLFCHSDSKRREWFQEEGFGYNILQRTKPQTIGFALADSPTALLAWLYEVRIAYL